MYGIPKEIIIALIVCFQVGTVHFVCRQAEKAKKAGRR